MHSEFNIRFTLFVELSKLYIPIMAARIFISSCYRLKLARELPVQTNTFRLISTKSTKLLQRVQLEHENGGQPITEAQIGSTEWPLTNRLDLIEASSIRAKPAYRCLNPDGSLCDDMESSLTSEKIVELYTGMVRSSVLDRIMFDSQRQGRISFYMTNFGEEATQFGSAAALELKDWVFAQYREAGVLIYRRMPLNLMLAQCYGNRDDLGRGRQMPIHYGNRQLNFVTISSPLTTQLPQAAGAAYAFKHDQSKRVVICYFGEGAASEGDAHAAMNFAATLSCPVLFFCRNNGYAISTPTSEQFVSDGIVNRALGYGMSAVRVDGNDLFAVYKATKAARDICQRESRPILIEAMTYRVGHHSTSDDSTAYRNKEEVQHWENNYSPIKRVYNYLVACGLWSESRQKELESSVRAEVIEAISSAEKVQKSPISTMFEDVYDELPSNLKRQCEELRAHLSSYGEHYPVKEHEGM